MFRAIHTFTGPAEGEGEEERISWIEGQIYTLDTFLRFMARHGYTLQKTRTQLPFEDLAETLACFQAMKDARDNAMLRHQMDQVAAVSAPPTQQKGG